MALLTEIHQPPPLHHHLENNQQETLSITSNKFKIDKPKNFGKDINVPDIFLFVVLCHRNAFAIGFQFMLNNFPICIVFYTKRMVQDSCDIILTGAQK